MAADKFTVNSDGIARRGLELSKLIVYARFLTGLPNDCMRPRLPCLSMKVALDTLVTEVARTGKPLLITKYGKPLAELHPNRPLQRMNPFGVWKGLLIVRGDVIAPLGVDWDSSKQA